MRISVVVKYKVCNSWGTITATNTGLILRNEIEPIDFWLLECREIEFKGMLFNMLTSKNKHERILAVNLIHYSKKLE